MRARCVLAVLTVCGGCRTGTLFTLGPRPAELAGEWIDSVKSTPTDSSIWQLTPSGDDRTLRLRLVQTSEGRRFDSKSTDYGSWYLSGQLADTAGRALCVVRRPRDGATCMQFRLDTVMRDNRPRRRLMILEYRGNRTTADRVLVERIP